MDEWTVHVCQGTPQVQRHVMERDVNLHAKHKMCPHPERTRRLQLEMSRFDKHLGQDIMLKDSWSKTGAGKNTENIQVMKIIVQNIVVFSRDYGSPTRCAFRVEIGPRQLQSPVRMGLSECFCHAAFLSEQSLRDQIGNFVPPDGHTVRTRDGMVDSDSTKSGPIGICSTKE